MADGNDRLAKILDSFGVTIVPTRRRRQQGETHAGGVLESILHQHGEDHLLLTLRCIRETDLNREALSSETIGAVSDVLAQRSDWRERPAEVVDAFAAIDLDALRARAVRLRPWPVRGTLRAFLYLVMVRQMDRPNWTGIAA